MITLSSSAMSILTSPSTVSRQEQPCGILTLTLSSALLSNTTERENSECGQTGVMRMHFICGDKMGPPAESE